MTPAQFTDRVLDAYGDTPDPRLREILAALISHLHAFATETGLTPQEWLAGLEFLTATGQKCDGERQEFILLSDVLGLSSLVDLVNAADGGTESTVLGPFYMPGAPQRAMGEQIGRPEDGEPVLVRGCVTDSGGKPLADATLDIWQASANGLYDTQDPGPAPCYHAHLRCRESLPGQRHGLRRQGLADQAVPAGRARRPAGCPPGRRDGLHADITSRVVSPAAWPCGREPGAPGRSSSSSSR